MLQSTLYITAVPPFLSESSISHPLPPVYALLPLFLKESFERIFASFPLLLFPHPRHTISTRPTALKTTRLCIHTHHTFSPMMMRNLFLFFSAMMMMTLMVVVEASWFRKSNTFNGGGNPIPKRLLRPRRRYHPRHQNLTH
jgi:hypothetical protein